MHRSNVCHKNSCRTQSTYNNRKTMSDNVCCTSMIKPLQQPSFCQVYEDATDDSTFCVGLRNSGTETRAVKIILIFHSHQWFLMRIWTQPLQNTHIQQTKKLGKTFSKSRTTVKRPIHALRVFFNLNNGYYSSFQ